MYDRIQDLVICGDGNEKAEASGKQTHKILDQQGMKFVRYVVFDESPLLMIITFIITFIITILTTVMQHWNCTTFILL